MYYETVFIEECLLGFILLSGVIALVCSLVKENKDTVLIDRIVRVSIPVIITVIAFYGFIPSKFWRGILFWPAPICSFLISFWYFKKEIYPKSKWRLRFFLIVMTVLTAIFIIALYTLMLGQYLR